MIHGSYLKVMITVVLLSSTTASSYFCTISDCSSSAFKLKKLAFQRPIQKFIPKTLNIIRGGSLPPTSMNNDNNVDNNSNTAELSNSSYEATMNNCDVNATNSNENIEEKSLSSFQSNLPMLLTYSRCLAIPLLILLFYAPDISSFPLSCSIIQRCSSVLCSSLFAFASFTDWLDGYLARKWQVTTKFGAFLDPVADKLMVSTALILLAGKYGLEIALPTCIILSREIAVSALREWMAEKSLRHLVQVGFQGKLKTATTMVSLTLLLWEKNAVGLYLLYFCTLLTVTSAWVYFKAAAPTLLKN